MGVNKAKSITFNSDGATWIWDRIQAVLSKAKVSPQSQIFQILDVCHAVENLNKGLKALGQEKDELNYGGKAVPFASLRTQLRDGHWPEVVKTLEQAFETISSNANQDLGEVKRIINYLRSHGEAGHMDYSKYSFMGLPLGSGSIESAIRRVVNLRMKNNGTFWRVNKAECILTLRASILSGRWDEDRDRIKLGMRGNRKLSKPPVEESKKSKSDERKKMAKPQ